MTDEIETETVSSKNICPMIADIISREMNAGLNADETTASLNTAVAHMAVGMIIADEIGVDSFIELFSAAEMMKKSFVDAVHKRNQPQEV